MFKATLYKIEDNKPWIEIAVARSDTQAKANQVAAASAYLGYGGHNRSDRAHEAIANGQRFKAPLGTWQLVEGYGS